MQKIVIARYSIIKGLMFDTITEKGIRLPKPTSKKQNKTFIENKNTKKTRFNRAVRHSSSPRNVTPCMHIVLNIIEQEIVPNFEPITKTSKNYRCHDKKATLNLKKMRQAKMLMQNASFDFYQEER